MPPNGSLILDIAKPTLEATLGAARSTSPAAIPPAVADRLLEIIRVIQASVTLERLSVLARVYETDEILARLPIVCRAGLTLAVAGATETPATVIHHSDHVVGSLSTDHVGYASFDLRMLRDATTLFALARQVDDDVDLDTLEVTLTLELHPFADPRLAIDALAVGDVSPAGVVVLLSMGLAILEGRKADPSLPALQNPGIADWRISPGSFAFSPERLVGSGGCEDLYPSDLSTHQFTFSQCARLIDKFQASRERKAVKGVRYGMQMKFENRWYPIGHSLGQVLYSLPLAPGEKVKLAISDWRREDRSSRSEQTTLTESLDHDSERDRTITEVVQAAVSEMQEGSSSMAGFSLSAVVPIDALMVGGSLGIGTTSASSQGLRDLSSTMAQQLSDRVHQSSSAVRQLRSTVISQTSQSDNGRFETRTVTNYNHCHTLTLLYYEVLRHYRVVTELSGIEPTLFVEFNLEAGPNLTKDDQVLAHRAALEQALLDRRHLSGFEALMRVRAARGTLGDAQAKFAVTGIASDLSKQQFSRFYTLFRTGSKGTDSNIFLEIEGTDGQRSVCVQVDPPRTNAEDDLDSKADDFESDSLTWFAVRSGLALTWGEIAGFVVRHARSRDEILRAAASPDRRFDFSWQLDHLSIVGATADDRTALILDRDVDLRLSDSESPILRVRDPATAGPSGSPPALTDFVSSADVALAEALMLHLNEFKDHYRLAALIRGDEVKRALAFAQVSLSTGVSLLDLIENRVVTSFGAEIAFPLTRAGDLAARKIFSMDEDDRPALAPIVSEDLISLPTRGVFAEGKLGHCSTCETIDNSRFWDFQTSPLPDDAPAIAPLETGSRFQPPAGLTPTPMPTSLLNIVNPAAAPDPSFAAALQTLTAANLFRDMSGSEALGGFMSSLAEGNTKSLSQLVDSQQKSQLIDQITGMDELTPEQKAKLIGQIVGGEPTSTGETLADAETGDSGSAEADDAEAATPTDETPESAGTTPATLSASDAPAEARTRRISSKPKLPRPGPPAGSRFIQVEVNLQGVLSPSEVTAYLKIDPAGEAQTIHVGPVSLGSTILQVQVPDIETNAGIAELRLGWEIRRTLSKEAAKRFQNSDGRIPVEVGMAVWIVGQCAFEFTDDDRVVTLTATPIISVQRIKERSFEAAELSASGGLGAVSTVISTRASFSATHNTEDEREVEFEVLAMRSLELTQKP